MKAGCSQGCFALVYAIGMILIIGSVGAAILISDYPEWLIPLLAISAGGSVIGITIVILSACICRRYEAVRNEKTENEYEIIQLVNGARFEAVKRTNLVYKQPLVDHEQRSQELMNTPPTEAINESCISLHKSRESLYKSKDSFISAGSNVRSSTDRLDGYTKKKKGLKLPTRSRSFKSMENVYLRSSSTDLPPSEVVDIPVHHYSRVIPKSERYKDPALLTFVQVSKSTPLLVKKLTVSTAKPTDPDKTPQLPPRRQQKVSASLQNVSGHQRQVRKKSEERPQHRRLNSEEDYGRPGPIEDPDRFRTFQKSAGVPLPGMTQVRPLSRLHKSADMLDRNLSYVTEFTDSDSSESEVNYRF